MNLNRSIVVDFGDRNSYENIIPNGKVFLELVIAYILSLGFQLVHHKYCTGGNCFTRHSHYARVRSGNITIWRIQCKRCKAVFTVIPSFLLRYFSCSAETAQKSLIAYHGGLSLENCAILFNISAMSLYRLICAIGKCSIPQVLCKAGVALPDHLWVDEKHTHCLENKGYIPIVSSGHLIWHIDYVDSLEETTLQASYQAYNDEAKKLEPAYIPKTITHDGFRSALNALKSIFQHGTSFILCWLHACWSLGHILVSFSKELSFKISWQLFVMLKVCHQMPSLQNISLRSRITALLRKYQVLLPAPGFQALKEWFGRKKPDLYESMYYPIALCFSYSIDHICNHLDRKLFMMKHFHHPSARKDLFLRGFALIHNFIPYQRFAKNAGQCPAEVSGAKLPHPDWFVSLLILTSEGYHKIR